MAPTTLRLRREHVDVMLAHAREAWPNEACGLLGGPPGQVARVYPVDNALRSPVAYAMAPDEQVRVMLEIEAAGWDLVGIFHSHPAGPPEPSATDVAQAYYPEAVYVILAPDGGQWAARAFRLAAGRVTPVQLAYVE